MASQSQKTPIAIMIGGGAKLPAIIKAAQKPQSKFYIRLVVSHKKESWGLKFALENQIPAVYWNLPDYRSRMASGDSKARSNYMKDLGWFISQPQYRPKLLVFGGWDLVMDDNFFNFFKCNFGEGYAAINAHPALLPKKGEGDKITLPDGTISPVIKGEQTDVFKAVLAKRLTYFGPTIHFMKPTVYDTGAVIRRKFIRVGDIKTIEDLRAKFMPIEDEIFIEAIDEVISRYLN
ncbi:MAG: hypothetical protein ACD_57C00322G0003 [uncultured bacterium]|uniref:phosphoribosylglycinamide formyltransferase 1 n=1 Tax=Candidatus Curtissbacteria bacterium RIFOXYA1_FULL_41_14 TaxID=1797737 RepID=A0A1F5HC67_9BACT|nr:MAG: hypothetical protein ACD_57C00322G0003 [uncultured bacterium]KKR60850.1 MAG: hypothetical protein UT99_C0006G0027 [Candidatus Curtissbacteria bacterium GW2011_GWA2_40_31]KKS02362.1 MAG: hypothetical protein UU53_C0002G0087 [Candidatus Curtissbacteria bacterium GW2011_GWC2_41_21]OGD79509.1 MAG: hypothetical protein A2683_02345 [Candidatus Curtissbacteria bacterium RIFCSPHIGHO2_01_FULL_34_40]OGD91477.1 MAG: hypothetical protein A3E14_00395 [Candidatus Curtissbacteria bacterium RIFCSPHIGHO